MRGGWLRLVLARAYADRSVVAVAWLVILATVTLLAASAIYAEAVGRSGLTARLARAAVEEANVQVRVALPPTQAADADEVVTRELTRALAPASGLIHHLGRSESFGFADGSADERDLAIFAFANGLPEHAHLVAGAWPAAGRAPLETVVSAAAADQLGVTVGDRLELLSRLGAELRPSATVVGIFEPTDPAAPYWWGDRLELDGVLAGTSFTTYGPLFVEDDDLLSRVLLTRVTLIWRAEPDIGTIDGTSIGPIASAVARLQDRLREAHPGASVDVQSGLPALLRGAGSSLQVSRAGILLLDLQLGLLGLYALVMLSALIIEQRRADTALLRSRGASGSQLTGYGLAEGTLLIVPAVAIGPWLAMALIAAFGVVGPLADIGVALHPRLTTEALALAAGAGVISLLGLALPQVAASGPLASVRRLIGRQMERTVAHRLGLDVALLVLAAIALWQLNQYGTPLTRSLRGTLGVDPLLVAAPMIGLLAGALLSLRVLPALALAVERLARRRRGPVLGAQQVARRPLRYTRAALLLIVAAAVTVFAGTYGATALRSQHDQVAYAVGTDVRLAIADQRVTPAELAAAVREPAGIEAAMAVLRGGYRLGTTGTRGTLLALDATHGEAIVTLRPDLAPAPLAELMARLQPAAQAGGGPGIALPASARRLAVDLRVELVAAAGGASGPFPEPWQGISATAVVIDGNGLLHRVTGAQSLGREGGQITFDLPQVPAFAGDESAALALALVAIEPQLRAPAGVELAGEVAVAALATSATETDAGWQALAVGDAGAWQAARIDENGVPTVLDERETVPAGLRTAAEAPLPAASRTMFSLRVPGVLSSTTLPLPALVNQRFITDSGLELGDEVVVAEPFSAARTVVPQMVISGFPTMNPDAPIVVVDYRALALADYADLHRLPSPGELWLSAPAADYHALRRTLAEGPLAVTQPLIAADDLAVRLTDPLSVGTAGALVLGTLAALLFAAVGFLVNAAVAARERTIEFGLLRALGVSRRQLTGALALESSFLLGASMAVGIALGVVLAIIALPTATVTPDGGRPVPPAAPVWPLEPLLGLLALAIILLVAAMLLFRRWLAATELATLLRLREE